MLGCRKVLEEGGVVDARNELLGGVEWLLCVLLLAVFRCFLDV